MTCQNLITGPAALAAGLCLALAPLAAGGTTLEVPGPLDLTIQEAADIAESLGVTQLNIAPGVYAESVTLPDNGYDLVLMGNPANPGLVVIDPSAALPDPILDSAIHVLGGQTSATQLVGLTLTGGNADGVDDGDAAPDERGGGLFVNGSSVTVIDCVLSNNVVSNAGGAFYINIGGASFTRCDFLGNTASSGGGAYVNSATASFTDCTFDGNETLGTHGGGMRSVSSTVTVTGCMFEGNTTATEGGAIWQGGANPTLTVRASMFVANHAIQTGGGLYILTGTADVRDSILNGNTAADTAGATYVVTGAGLTLVNSTIVHNEGAVGGLAGNGAKVIKSAILWDNTGGSLSGSATVTYSMVEGGWPGTGNTDPAQGPIFVSPGGADATTGTMDDDLHLAAGSPAIDAGDASAVIGQYPLDHDGLPRAVDDPATADTGLAVLGLAVDMGAYEFQAGEVDTCPADTDDNGEVNVTDLLALLAGWGACP